MGATAGATAGATTGATTGATARGCNRVIRHEQLNGTSAADESVQKLV